jgi:hypothetical protein
VLVCAGVLKLQLDPNPPERKFKTPYINSKYIVPALFAIGLLVSLTVNKTNTLNFFKAQQLKEKEEIIAGLDVQDKFEFQKSAMQDAVIDPQLFKESDVSAALIQNSSQEQIQLYLERSNIDQAKYLNNGWEIFKHQIPYWIFIVIALLMSYYCFKHSFSLIPVLGLMSCLYMMSELGLKNWIGFSLWLVAGLVIYFGYSHKHSKLNHAKA